MKKLLSLYAVLFLASVCFSQLATPTQQDADRGAAKYPGYTLEQLVAGKAIFEDKCSQCHGTKNPTKKDPEKWEHTVDRMVKKASKKEKKVITAEEQDAINKYLFTMAGAGK